VTHSVTLSIMLAYDRRSVRSPSSSAGSRITRLFGAAGTLALVAAVCVSCEAGSGAPEATGTTSSAVTIGGLFPTGVNAAGTPLAVGAIDPHYVLSSNDPNFPGPNAIVVTPAGGWTGNTATSKWISVQASTTGAANGVYTYTTTFTLAGVDPTSATLTGSWACDDSCTMTLNGTTVAQKATPGWGTVGTFTVAAGSPFVLGANTLAVVTPNTTGGPTGVQIVTISGNVGGCTADTQCTNAQFCNTQTAACTAKLLNGTAIPTLTGHTPALTGTCTTAVGTAVCSSGVCDPKDNECGIATGDATCTLGDGANVCRSGACSNDGKCEPAGGCDLDSDCTGGKWCDEATHACTAKLPNTSPIPNDPTHTNPTLDGKCTLAAALLVCTSAICDTKNDECGLANGDGPCTILTGDLCQSGTCSLTLTCKPATGCNTDGDCTGGDWCDEATHVCTAKLPNGTPIPSDPTHTMPTLNGSCTTAAATLVCASLVCDTKDNKCGFAPGDGMCTPMDAMTVCRSGVCVGGVCEPPGDCNTDADCTGGTWCDESMHLCTAKLANGTKIPDDPPHTNPTLGGVCTTGAATLVCMSGLCSTATNDCAATSAVPDAGAGGDAGTGNDAGTGAGSDAGADAGTGAGNDAGTGTGNDAGTGSDAGTGAGSDAGADAGTGAGSDGGANAGDDAGDDSGSGDAAAGDDSGSGDDGGAAGQDASVNTDSGTTGGGEDAAGNGSGSNSDYLEGGGLSCAMSRGGSRDPGGVAVMMCMLALGAAVGRGRRNR
jgi:hypothetical protein